MEKDALAIFLIEKLEQISWVETMPLNKFIGSFLAYKELDSNEKIVLVGDTKLANHGFHLIKLILLSLNIFILIKLFI